MTASNNPGRPVPPISVGPNSEIQVAGDCSGTTYKISDALGDPVRSAFRGGCDTRAALVFNQTRRKEAAVNRTGIAAMLLLCAGLFATLSGCVSYESLDRDLERAVGQRVTDIRYPPLDRVKESKISGTRVTTTYQLTSVGRCRWEFVVDDVSKTVLGWRYPDDEARKGCQGLATTRP